MASRFNHWKLTIPSPNSTFTRRRIFGNGTGKLELSVWDFAGQHDYYHNHHYFLSTRTMFLVIWNIFDEDTALKGLEF